MEKVFKVIETLLDKDARSNVSKSFDLVVTSNNAKTCDPKLTYNNFNDYYISIDRTLASNIHSNVRFSIIFR